MQAPSAPNPQNGSVNFAIKKRAGRAKRPADDDRILPLSPGCKFFRQKNRIFSRAGVKLCSRDPVTHSQQTYDEKEIPIMSTKNSNKINVPEARAAMDKFKMEAAADLRVPAPS